MNRRRFLRLLCLAPVVAAVTPAIALAGAAPRFKPFEFGAALGEPGQALVTDCGRYVWSAGAAADWEIGIGLINEPEPASESAAAA